MKTTNCFSEIIPTALLHQTSKNLIKTRTINNNRLQAIAQRKIQEAANSKFHITAQYKKSTLSESTCAARVSNDKIIQQVTDVTMHSTQEKLVENIARKAVTDRIFSSIKKSNEQGKYQSLGDVRKMPIINKITDHDKDAIASEVYAKICHDSNFSKNIDNSIRRKLGSGIDLDDPKNNTVGPDIIASEITYETGTPPSYKSNFLSGKSCVITALMFSEGSVLGANSVEELHFTLSTRFKSTWRHYSEDKVYETLYEHLGYKKTVPASNTKLENLASVVSGYASGMVSISGHMVGFKKDNGDLHIRDNDEGLKKADTHTRKKDIITTIWHK